MKKIILALAFVATASMAFAFDWKPAPNDTLRQRMLEYAAQFAQQTVGTPAYSIINSFIERQKTLALTEPYAWISETHSLVAELKRLYTPQIDDGGTASRIRRGALRLLDYPLHVDNRNKEINPAELAAYNTATGTYLATTRQQALDFLKQPAPADGKVQFCLIYNMGYFVRTSSRIFAIDIHWKGTQEEADFVASKADAIFVSHPHSDHYTPMLLKAFDKAGKPVVLPAASLPGFDGNEAQNKVVVDRDYINEPLHIAGLDVKVIHGAQEVGENDSVPNNVYIISFDGFSMLHQGDNEAWGKQKILASMPALDFIFAPAWNGIKYLLTPALQAKGAEVKAPIFFPTHQNELEHVVRHRESYWELYNRKDRLGDPEYNYPPYVLMDNGESITLSHIVR